MTPLNTDQAAAALDVSAFKVRQLAHRLGVGYKVGGKSGWKFSPADVERMRDSMRPAPMPPPRRRRRRAS